MSDEEFSDVGGRSGDIGDQNSRVDSRESGERTKTRSPYDVFRSVVAEMRYGRLSEVSSVPNSRTGVSYMRDWLKS